jgi:hypothetical protein
MPAAAAFSVPEEDRHCSICGWKGKLTFEHIPPRRCFNNKPVALHTIWSFAKHSAGPDKFPAGMGRRSLCTSCNGRSARLYGDAFAHWVERGLQYIDSGPTIENFALPFTIRPLEVAKQMAAMSLAVNSWSQAQGPTFQSLRRLVDHAWLVGRPVDARLFVYFAPPGSSRMSPYMGLLWTSGVKNVIGYAEVAFPPFGFVLLAADEACRTVAARLRLCDITHFFERKPATLRTEWLRIPWLKPIGSGLLDYQGFAVSPTFLSEQGAARAQRAIARRRSPRQ